MDPYNWKKSLKALRILSRAYIRHRIYHTPHWGHLYVTRRCNLSCDYCFFRDPHKKELSNAELERILDRMWDMGVAFLAFHGGEPTLRKGFPDLVRYAWRKGFFQYLNTNGTRLSPEYIDRLGEAGIDLINLSVDSLLEFPHSHKDIAHHKQVLEDLLAARRRHGFELTVTFVLTNRNIDVVLDTLELMHQYRIPICIGFIVKHLSQPGQEPSLFFRTPAEQAHLFEVLDEILMRRRQGYNIVEPAAYFEDLKRFVRGDLQWECLAGRDSIGVDTLGELKFCGTLPTEDLSIFDFERLDTRALYRLRKERYGDCHRHCITNCRYVTAYYYRHPLRFVVEMLWFRPPVRRAFTRLADALGAPRVVSAPTLPAPKA